MRIMKRCVMLKEEGCELLSYCEVKLRHCGMGKELLN